MPTAVLALLHRRRAIAVSVLAVAAATLVIVLLANRRSSSAPVAQPSRSPAPSASATRGGRVPAVTAPPASAASNGRADVVPPLVRTDDPTAYARAVAGALFDVSEADVGRSAYLRFWAAELPTVVYADGAAKGLSLRTQNDDALDNLTTWWIPTQPVWASEAAQHTTSRITITSVSVPDYWANAVADGTLRDPGLRMERVMGVLTQTYGTDAAHRQTSSRSVVIDLALLCGPTQPGGCRLLAPQQPPSAGS